MAQPSHGKDSLRGFHNLVCSGSPQAVDWLRELLADRVELDLDVHLHNAVGSGDLRLVKELLRAGADPCAQAASPSEGKATPREIKEPVDPRYGYRNESNPSAPVLWRAVYLGRVEAAKILVAAGADLSRSGYHPTGCAPAHVWAGSDHLESHGAESVAMMDWLADSGVDFSQEDRSRRQPLLWALLRKRIGQAERLILSGRHKSRRKSLSPVPLVASLMDKDYLREILNAGEDPDRLGPRAPDEFGAQAFARRNLNPPAPARSENTLATTLCCRRQLFDALEILLRAGADPRRPDDDGDSAAALAAASGSQALALIEDLAIDKELGAEAKAAKERRKKEMKRRRKLAREAGEEPPEPAPAPVRRSLSL